jgi:hypothetical protein
MPLHYGKAPRWLFSRMKMLAREIVTAIVAEFGQAAVLKRFSDPYWFQAFGCVLGFDWHSSGLTTTVMGAVKEGLRGLERDTGIFVAGGKGAASRKTPAEIESFAERYSVDAAPLVYASRMSAKVDNTAVQDGYQLYHHVLLFTREGRWAVVQQGMNDLNRMARRYHWCGEDVKDFVVEPHSAVCCDERHRSLNMVARESADARDMSARLASEHPDRVMREIESASNLIMTRRHWITNRDIDPRRLYKTFIETYERQPSGFEELIGVRGVGPKTVRALSLVSEIIYGKSPAYSDPARFSYAHGGKDGTPYPVDRRTYDETVEVMKKAIQSSRLGNSDKLRAVRKLAGFYE